mmetsp:Transcript_31034/g.23078  ORF Transcript_31034/g.23078 Transcript_31034/m.23078 type:complete len:178 (+) Transcript_31034:63-596(+)
MGSLCICGVCIPYSVLWPMILLFLKQVWDLFHGKPKETVENHSKRSKSEKDELSSKASEYGGYIGDLESMEQYQNLFQNSDQSNSVFLMKFTAKWCKPCQQLAPVFEKVVNENKDKVYAVSIDVDDFDELAAKYHAVLLPIIVAVHDGQEIDRFRGKEESDLTAFMNSLQTKVASKK